MMQAGHPFRTLNSLPQDFTHLHPQAREMTLESDHPTAGTVRLTGFPYKLSQTPAEVHAPPPLLGEHTEEILTSLLDYSPEDVASLRERKVI